MSFDLAGLLRRIRRAADVSQRELAEACGLSKSSVAAVESGDRGLDARVLARLAAVAGLRLALLDGEGREVSPMDAEAVRDGGGRRYPAHLDIRHGDDGWWHGPHRYDRDPVTYTFDRDRRWRDLRRVRGDVPDDHRREQPGDDLRDRAEARRRAAARARRERIEQARAAAADRPDPVCTCPPACDDVFLDDRPPTPGRPRPHAPGCACGCDLE
ncbi:helix-turn-helix domain-containing protein [Geodermatophilus sp. SYSU D01119]